MADLRTELRMLAENANKDLAEAVQDALLPAVSEVILQAKHAARNGCTGFTFDVSSYCNVEKLSIPAAALAGVMEPDLRTRGLIVSRPNHITLSIKW